jgi:undecaprenyl-diphosphatase
MIDIIKAIILGIIEGITEWLPISSTGHLILAQEFIKMNVSANFLEMFNVVIQLGAIMAVVVLFFHKLNPFSPKKSSVEKKDTLSLWGKVLIASVPAAIIGLAFNDWIDEKFYNPYTVAIMLIVYGVLFIVVERVNKDKVAKINSLKELTIKTVLIIGLFQVLALIPGTSRSGATIIGALLIGTARPVAAEFTFFLAIPVMFGASLLKIIGFGFHFTSMEATILLVGCLVSFLVSIASIRFLMNYVKNHDFKIFGYYRIILGLVLLIYFIQR